MRIGRLLQMRNAGLGDQEGAARIDLMHQVIALHLGLLGAGERNGAGIVDADIDAAEPLHTGVHGRRHLILEADVAGDGQRLAAGLLDPRAAAVWMVPGSRGIGLGGLGGDGDIGAVARRPQRDGKADAPAGAGDEQAFCLASDMAAPSAMHK